MPHITHVDPQSPVALPAIQQASAQLRARGLTPDGYVITVVRKDKHTIVTFVDANRPAGMRGGGGKPGFEVEMSNDLHVLRENFVR